jgi:ribose transport system ATP-binding protein
MLEAHGISVRFGPTQALDNVDFSAQSGEVHAVVGENGSGKSTLMRVLAGEHQPDSGELTLDGEPFRPLNPHESRQKGVALIHQELALCPDLTVAENIVLGLEPRQGLKFDAGQARSTARRVLDQMGCTNIPVDAMARTLPIAALQMVEIARALASEARVILFDEPTSSLTQEDVALLFTQIRRLRAEGCTVVYISHFLDEIAAIADRATILRDGRFVETVSVGETSSAEIASLMVGRPIEDLYPRSDRKPGEAILDVNVDDPSRTPQFASLNLRSGEVVGIAGLNGAGRTELARMIFGLDRPAKGRLTLRDRQAWLSPRAAWRSRLGFLSEDRKAEGLATSLSIRENIVLSRSAGGTIHGADERKAVDDMIGRLRIKCAGSEDPVERLSGGNQQKVALARLLDADSEVLILDEPTRGIDVGSKAEIYALIDQLAASGKAVLLISSYLPELLGVCDRIAVMARGVLSEPIAVQDTSEADLMARCALA